MRTTISPKRWGLLLLALLMAGTLLLVPAAAHAKKAGATPKRLKGVPSTVQPGAAFEVRVRVRAGSRATRAGSVVLLLSSDRRASRGDARVGKAALSALKRRGAKTVRVRGLAPGTLGAGDRHLIACVVNKEGRRGACRATKRKLTITPAPQTAPPAGAGNAAPAPAGPAPAPPGGDAGRGTTPDPDPGPRVPGEDPAVPLQTPNPRSVTPTTEGAGAAASKRVGAAGGTITATAGDGSTFELVIPPDALLSEVEITMTPLATVGGMPFSGGLVAGVELLPHGLRLMAPARLTITPAGPLPLERQAPFAYSEGGADFRLYPLGSDPAKLEMSLSHFSGAGVADGTEAQREAQDGRPPADPEAQYEQEAQRLIEKLREGDTEGFQTEFVALMRRYYQQVVRPRMRAAETDDTLASLAITSFLGWLRQAELLGLGDHFENERNEGWASVERIVDNAYAKAFERCKAGQTSEAVTMLSIERTRQLLGFESGTDVFADIRACVRYELDVSGAAAWEIQRSGSSDTHHVRVHALVPLELKTDTAEWHLGGEAAPEVLEYRVEEVGYEGGCPFTAHSTQVKEPMKVRAFLDLNPRQRREDGNTIVEPPPPSPAVYVDDAVISETYHYCGTLSPGHSFYNDSFEMAHASRQVAGTPEFLFDRWILGPPPEVGRFENHFDGTNYSGGDVDFDTEMLLRHHAVR